MGRAGKQGKGQRSFKSNNNKRKLDSAPTAQPVSKRSRIASEDEDEEDDDEDAGAETQEEDSDLDSDADDALEHYAEGVDSEDDIPAIIDGLTDSDSDLEESSDDDEDGADFMSDEEDEEEDDDAKEDRYADRIAKLTKRQELLEARENKRLAKQKLPVRDVGGDWTPGLFAELNDEQAQLAAEAAQEELEQMEEDQKQQEDPRLIQAKARQAELQAAKAAQDSLLHGQRFGLLAPYAIMTLPKRSVRIHQAREQIAHLSQNVVNDPEVGLSHLRRLLVFAGVFVVAPHQSASAAQADEEDANGTNGAGPSKPKKAPVDIAIRHLAILSLMVVFADIIPGYRIRALTDEEKSQKVTQEVSRRRDWEEGLLKCYRDFLELCEQAIKARTELSSTALRALTHLLTRATHFNYRQNLLRLVIARLSRSRARNAASASLAPASDSNASGSRPALTKGSWDADCTTCSSAIIEILQRDLTGEVSLEVVRLLHRMIKEGGYAVDARVLDILLHLRLKEELGDVRASTTTSSGGRYSKRKDKGDGLGKDDPRHKMGKGKVKPKDVRKGKGQHLSKKEVKKMREVREIEKEMKEAEAEVDKEEREKHHTETLKLLFVLYFSILKSPSAPSSLLCSALDGLCKYGHRINVEFFRDLIRVLRDLVVESRRQAEGGGIGSVYASQGPMVVNGIVIPSGPAPVSEATPSNVPGYPNGSAYGIGGKSQAKRSHRDTLCLLLTAFDLLFSQGQSLNLDLSDFIAHLYSVMISLALEPTVEDAPVVLLTEGDRSDAKEAVRAQRRDARAAKSMAASSLADLLFRTLELALLKPKTSTLPPERLGSFVKRLLSCALHWPANTAVRALGIVKTLVGRDGRLEALFETEDRAVARRANVPTTTAAAALLRPGGGRGNLASATLANLSDEALDRVAGSAGPDEKGPLAAGEVAWEVVLLAQHVNEDVRDAAEKVLGSVGTAPKNPGATRRR
ncbi:hypothetical protein OC846_003008 [Tilletia horrida]|uniref:Nucleolar complex-associated protein 3 n=1 Tax=Tilletia horrida TaxID=155126 RepID=A0AAN6GSP4_9BASI|nr:hypothetical protein OC845_004961 [Tilletia horrida]KAK0552157.1 hypothetical protein OC846_003008 [Tilletia horrida]KAK0563599.1 hypothetical protein OC861_004713 [Tilletia horrida]